MCNLTFAFPASRPSKRLRLFGRFRTPCGAVVGAVACPARFAEGLFFSDVSGADQRPSRGRSAGPDFSTMRNRGKNRLGRSPLRTSPGYEADPASVLRSALAPVGSHGWSGKSMDRAPFSVRRHRSSQGLTLVCGVPAAVRSPPGQKASLREGGGTASAGSEGACSRNSRALTQWAERSGLSKTSDKSLFSVPTCKCTARLLPQSPPVTASSRREPSPQPSSLYFN